MEFAGKLLANTRIVYFPGMQLFAVGWGLVSSRGICDCALSKGASLSEGTERWL